MPVTLLLLLAATAEKPLETSGKYRCMDGDGTMVDRPEQCPPVNPPGGPFVIAPPPVPKPTLSRPPKPRNNPGLWVNMLDYPRSSHGYDEGTSGFRVTVGPDGLVTACDITMSSGSAMLDAATCSNITRRARFEPATDADGKPTIGSYANRVTWRIPAGPSFARQAGFLPNGPRPIYGTYIEIRDDQYPQEALERGMRGTAHIVLSISDKGVVTECATDVSTGYPLLDSKACDVAKTWTFFPARGSDDKPVAGSTRHLFSWVLPEAWKAYQQTGTYPPKPQSQ